MITKIPNININLSKVPNFVTVDPIISLVKSLFEVTLVDTFINSSISYTIFVIK